MRDGEKPTLTELGYIGDVTANAECPFCKNTTWAYATEDDGSPRTVALGYTRGNEIVAIPALPLACEKCGFLRFHDRAMVRVKMREGGGNG